MFIRYLSIVFALMSRDLKVLRSKLIGFGIDSACLIFGDVLLFGYFFPLFGMPSSFIAPMFIGSIVFFMITFSYSYAFDLIHDFASVRFVDYHLTLPIPTLVVFTQYITSLMLETAIITLPQFVVGASLLGAHFSFAHTSWLAFAAMYFLALLFFSSFFLGLALWYPFLWIFHNLWVRRMEPMLCLSANVLIWKKVYAISYLWSSLLLINPLTYIVEGLRAALLENNLFLPFSLCAGMTILFICVNFCIIYFGSKKRLDPI